MKYKQLGHTGLYVSEICLGTMTFGGAGRHANLGGLDLKASTEIVKRSLDAGMNFLDTADVYSMGQSEELVGQAIKDLGIKRSDVVVATKCYGRMGAAPNDTGASRGHIMDAVDASLKRLKMDYIDLYQIHANDPVTPLDETMRALDDLTRQGKVRYVGCSNWAAWKIMKAQGLADAKGYSRFATLQAYYSIAGRDLERDIVPLLLSEGIGLMVWSPLVGGLLTGKFNRDGTGPEGARRTNFKFPPVNEERAFDCVDAMREIAKAKDVSIARVALAWLLAKPAVTSVIIGARNMDQLEDNIGAANVTLSEGEMKKLDEVSALPMEYPGWMVNMQAGARVPQPKQ